MSEVEENEKLSPVGDFVESNFDSSGNLIL